MKVATVQIAKAKKLGIAYHDITVKSGDSVFAPTWSMVSSYKNVIMTKYEYTKNNIELMRKSFELNSDYWLDFIKRDYVVLACYCKSKEFCHRYLLVSLLGTVCEHYGIPFEYIGEIE